MTKKSETAFRRRLFGFSSGISCCGHHAPTRGLLLRRGLRPVRYHLTAKRDEARDLVPGEHRYSLFPSHRLIDEGTSSSCLRCVKKRGPSDAEPLYSRSLAIAEKILGPDIQMLHISRPEMPTGTRHRPWVWSLQREQFVAQVDIVAKLGRRS
jgi:hypothetical protein